MGNIVTVSGPKWRWLHKLFFCPTFWNLEPPFHCPICTKPYWCYWDGNDIEGHGIDICHTCAKVIESGQ